jgi:uncharacterized Tic20 family protein
MSDEPNVPAGWYPTPDGSQRYWDGSQWTGHVAPTSPGPAVPAGGAPTSDERTMAMLAHLLGLFASFLGPLIIYLVKKDESPFVRDQAGEALNFAITVAIFSTAYVIVSFILLFVLVGFVLFLLLPFLLIGVAVLHIIAAVSANRGEYYRYPLTLRFIT